jgi:FKBP-type peptidyl-prolyl cis-trans isomerase SlyD
MQIADRHIVAFHYTLTDDEGTVLDSSSGREPLQYLHGFRNIVPGLERALTGRSIGDSFSVDVPPAEGYGARNPGMVQTVPRAIFQGVDEIKPGMSFQADGPQGPMTVRVTAVEGDRVIIDGNHPLADKVLHFTVEITAIRAARPDEIQAGRAL